MDLILTRRKFVVVCISSCKVFVVCRRHETKRKVHKRLQDVDNYCRSLLPLSFLPCALTCPWEYVKWSGGTAWPARPSGTGVAIGCSWIWAGGDPAKLWGTKYLLVWLVAMVVLELVEVPRPRRCDRRRHASWTASDRTSAPAQHNSSAKQRLTWIPRVNVGIDSSCSVGLLETYVSMLVPIGQKKKKELSRSSTYPEEVVSVTVRGVLICDSGNMRLWHGRSKGLLIVKFGKPQNHHRTGVSIGFRILNRLVGIIKSPIDYAQRKKGVPVQIRTVLSKRDCIFSQGEFNRLQRLLIINHHGYVLGYKPFPLSKRIIVVRYSQWVVSNNITVSEPIGVFVCWNLLRSNKKHLEELVPHGT